MADSYPGESYRTHGEHNSHDRIRGGLERDRSYGRSFDQDREGRSHSRNDNGSGGDHDRDAEGLSFWTQMKDEARSWFGGDGDRRGRDHSPDGPRGEAHRGGARRERWADDYGRSASGRRDGQQRSGRGSGQDSPGGFLVIEEYELIGPSAYRDDHYRNWRTRHMQQLDQDYRDYCREREHQFHRDFDDWRRNRQSKSSEHAGSDRSSASSNQRANSSPTKLSGTNSDAATRRSGAASTGTDETKGKNGFETERANAGKRSEATARAGS